MFISGYAVFLPGNFNVPTVVFSYILLAVLPAIFVIWKLVRRTQARSIGLKLQIKIFQLILLSVEELTGGRFVHQETCGGGRVRERDSERAVQRNSLLKHWMFSNGRRLFSGCTFSISIDHRVDRSVKLCLFRYLS